MRSAIPTAALVEGILSGNRRDLARAITHIENESAQAGELLTALYPHTGRAYLIGVTGAPGTGKSSLVNALTLHLRGEDKTIGIVAVDPSSPFSRGAVLGDRIRMRDLSGDSGVFIRSMASRGSLGGLARTTADVVRVMDAAGFDFIIIETVGAGQSEVSIAATAYTTLVIDVPGLGDDIQATKAGILEIADILVVNKADRPGVENAVRALKAMLDLGHRMQMVAHHGRLLIQEDGGAPDWDHWQVPVMQTVSPEGKGIPELATAIQQHRAYLEENGLMQERERQRLQAEVAERLQATLLDRLLANTPTEKLSALLDAMLTRQMSPAAVVAALVEQKEREHG